MSSPPTAGGLGRVGASSTTTPFIQKGRINAIPARIRAFVKVIHDLDRDQFPEVFTSLNNNNSNGTLSTTSQSSLVVYGADSASTAVAPHRVRNQGAAAAATGGGVVQLNETAVHALSVALGREVKTQQDWEDFAVALEEYSRHLSSVDMASLERSGLGQLVTLSASIDREASSAGLSMARELSAVYACHQTILRIVQTDYILYSTCPVVFELFVQKMTELLQDLEQTVVEIARRRESRRRQQMQHARTVSPTSKTSEAVCDDELTEKEASFRLVELNSTLEYHISHLTWFMSVTTDETSTANGLPTKGEVVSTAAARRKRSSEADESPLSTALQATRHAASSGASVLFDARDFINDVSAAEIWCHHVGRYSPACSVQEFMPALASFPEWAHEPILKIMDFRTCGIVSAVGMLRVLSLWGPYLLLDRNLGRDLSRGFINLSYTTEMAEAQLRQQIAEKPPPPPADAWTSSASLASKPQRFGIPTGTCVMTLSTDKNCAFDLLLVTSKGNIKRLLVDREGGTWILQGVSQEDYENPTDACVSFPHIFSNPAGEKFYKVPETTSREAATSEAFSILHRACFRNNVPYVAKLLDRGNGVIANSAVVDPSITSALSWTPLLAAVNNPNGDPFLICRMLLDSGADVSYSDASTCTALYYAIVNRYVKAAKVLIEHYVAEMKKDAAAAGSLFAGAVGTPLSSEMFLPTNRALSRLALRSGIPAPTTSAVTVPLFVGLGAHFYNASDVDNLRLEHSLPDLEIIRMLLRVTNDLCVTRAAYEILFHKLNKQPMRHREQTLNKKGSKSGGEENESEVAIEYGTASVREWTRCYGGDVSWGNTYSPDLGEGRGFEWNFGNFPCPTLTDDEASREVRAVANHTLLCQANDTACRKVLHAIGDHCFLLSARRLVAQVRNQ